MKKSAVIVALILALMLVIAPAHANEDSSTTYLRTSYNDDNYIVFSIDNNRLTVTGVLAVDSLCGYMVCLGETREFFDTSNGRTFSSSVSLRSIKETTAVDFYTKVRGESAYRSMVWDRIYISPTDDGYVFLQSDVLQNNLIFQNEWVNPGDYLDDTIPEEIRIKSDEIVGEEEDDYKKIFLLHRWVADNIYYDYDSCNGAGRTFYVAEDVLTHQRSVCAGYAELLMQLIQAQGIPCMKVTTYALGSSEDGGSFSVKTENTHTTKSNHAHVEAYVNGRWVVMDPTWDSNNKYENGTYDKMGTTGYYYFDPTYEALALDHKYITRGDRKIRLEADGTISNKNCIESQTKPSSWALAEVGEGISLGLIPYDLQCEYQSNITREEFCRTLVQMMCVQTQSRNTDELLSIFNLTMEEDLFTDTTSQEVYAANLLGIVNGTGNGVFAPGKTISRQEAATMLTRAATVLGLATDSAPDAVFVDSHEIQPWARQGVNFTYYLGVMKGVGESTFAPQGNYSREQAYLTILRLCNALEN